MPTYEFDDEFVKVALAHLASQAGDCDGLISTATKG
jgi:hypothetical protein